MRRWMLGYTLLAALIFLPKALFPDVALVARLFSPRLVDVAGNAAELGALLFGTVFAVRSARRLEADDIARPSWRLLAAYFACFTLGQAVLATYRVVLRAVTPVPSVGDLGFLLGYVFLLIASARFVRIYLASGLPVGTPRAHARTALGLAAVFAVVGYVVLSPIARLDVPLEERAIDIAYPVLDFVVLVVTLVLVRITLHFRGGKVWAVWGSLGLGFVMLAVADILFAYLTLVPSERLEALDSLLFVLGYFYAACGVKLQHQMLSD